MIEVIHCKDCKNNKLNGGKCWRYVELGPDGYCSKGEKDADRRSS